MPKWMLGIFLPLVLQAVTPMIVEGIKKGVEMIVDRMPGTMVVALAGIIGETINQAQSLLTGANLPAGLSGLIGIALNELRNDFANASKSRRGPHLLVLLLAGIALATGCGGDGDGNRCTITGTFVEAGQSFLICAEGDVRSDDHSTTVAPTPTPEPTPEPAP